MSDPKDVKISMSGVSGASQISSQSSSNVSHLIGSLQNQYTSARASKALVRLGGKAVPGLVKAISDPSVKLVARAMAVGILVRIAKNKSSLTPSIIQAFARVYNNGHSLAYESKRTMILIMRFKPFSGEKSGVNFVVKALEDHDPRIRRCALETLNILGKGAEPAIKAVIISALINKSFKDPSSDLRNRAVYVLKYTAGKKGSKAEPALIKALSSPNANIRTSTAIALGEIKSTAALPAFLKILGDPSQDVRWYAAFFLGKVGRHHPGLAVPALIKALRDPDKSVRHAAIQALGDFKEKAAPAVSALIPFLGNADKSVRNDAARTLSTIGKKAEPALIKALRDRNADVRASAVYALGEMQSVAAIPAILRRAIYDRDPKIRGIARSGLITIGKSKPTLAIPVLVQDLRSGSKPLIRAGAAAILGYIGIAAAPAIPALKKACLDRDPYVAKIAAWAIRRIEYKLSNLLSVNLKKWRF